MRSKNAAFPHSGTSRARFLPTNQPTLLEEILGAIFALGLLLWFAMWLAIPFIAAVWVCAQAIRGGELLWQML